MLRTDQAVHSARAHARASIAEKGAQAPFPHQVRAHAHAHVREACGNRMCSGGHPGASVSAEIPDRYTRMRTHTRAPCGEIEMASSLRLRVRSKTWNQHDIQRHLQ